MAKSEVLRVLPGSIAQRWVEAIRERTVT